MIADQFNQTDEKRSRCKSDNKIWFEQIGDQKQDKKANERFGIHPAAVFLQQLNE